MRPGDIEEPVPGEIVLSDRFEESVGTENDFIPALRARIGIRSPCLSKYGQLIIDAEPLELEIVLLFFRTTIEDRLPLCFANI